MKDVNGETQNSNRWSKCVVCGYPTNLPPTCCDLTCEITLEKQS